MSPGAEYLQFFSDVYQFSPTALVSLFLLSLFRLAPIVVVAPFLGSKLPSPVKMGMLISFSFILLPHIAMTSQTALNYTIDIVFLAAKEFLIGFILAFFVNVPFQFAQSAGVLVDFLRGSSSLQVTDPFSQTQTSPIGNLYNYVLIVMFYSIGGFFLFFNSLFVSYTLIPVDAFLPPAFFSLKLPFWQLATAVVTKVLAIGIQLSAPALLAVLMTEVFLGIANRLAPQVQIVFLGMSLKSLIGLALLCLGWFFILEQMDKQTLLWLKEIDKALQFIPVKT
jgi:type III secretion protein SpaR/YscT/HrcT